ncbi:hypothetical protein [Holospora undulata]|uniref:Transposase n=1 Tax=Holospora undulata HU1 TaxID=1321371 RepID=A0A061JIK7_9PROT|nr:hypothetical protein [Holospora undulata]ETZ05512.1 hypothetical protein K737_300048 [Holospora undulata HU1]
MKYSADFRRRVLEIKEEEGLSFDEKWRCFKVGIASVIRWWKKIVPQYKRNKSATSINMEDSPDVACAERLEASHSGWGTLTSGTPRRDV